MSRTLLCSVAGAMVGFLIGYFGVCITFRSQPTGDIGPFVLAVGSFLAGTGAIAGAIVGGVADLRKQSRRNIQIPRDTEN